jgi:hypothetical protein
MMLKIIKSKETGQISVITGQSKISGDNLNNIRHESQHTDQE